MLSASIDRYGVGTAVMDGAEAVDGRSRNVCIFAMISQTALDNGADYHSDARDGKN